MPVLLLLVLAIPLVFFIDKPEIISFISNKSVIQEGELFYVKLLMVPNNLVCYIFIFVCIYYFKELINDFSRMHVFTERIVKYFSKIGKILFIVGLMLFVISFIESIVFTHKFNVDLIISPKLLCVSFGLFFQVLGEMFKISIQMKKENDLTI